MLRFFHAPAGLTLATNIRFPAQRFRSSDQAKQNGVIPFSHIYLTSASQLAHFRRFAGRDDRIVTLPDSAAEIILSHSRCPVNLTFREEGVGRALETHGAADQRAISIAIINGMGRGYGDNIAGLGALQHLRKLLESRYDDVTIDLLQRNSAVQGIIHSRYDAASATAQLPVSVTRFFRYDGYVDLSDLLSIKQFSALPLYEFFLQALSLQHVVTDSHEKRTLLNVQPERRLQLRGLLQQRSLNPSARFILFHPTASTPLRSMPPALISRIVDTLLGIEDVVVVAGVELSSSNSYPPERVLDLRDQSEGINDFLDIIASCDGVITVGTVVYHVAGNLDIPTLLVPTVQADVDSAGLLPSVECYLPGAVKPFISPKHMSRLPADIAAIQPIWDAVAMDDVAHFVEKIH